MARLGLYVSTATGTPVTGWVNSRSQVMVSAASARTVPVMVTRARTGSYSKPNGLGPPWWRPA